MALQMPHRQFSNSEFDQMIEAGILREDDLVELIRGEIIEMAPISLRHSVCVTRLELLFHEKLGRAAIVWGQNPIKLPDNSQPQPDVVLLEWRDDLYGARHPGPEDVLLIVEVADSSLTYDRKVKVPLYAEVGVPSVWLVNLSKNNIEVYSDPVSGKYQVIQQAGRGNVLSLSDLDAEFEVNDILG